MRVFILLMVILLVLFILLIFWIAIHSLATAFSHSRIFDFTRSCNVMYSDAYTVGSSSSGLVSTYDN